MAASEDAKLLVEDLLHHPEVEIRPSSAVKDNASVDDKRAVFFQQLQQPALFLERYGRFLPVDRLKYFDQFSNDYEVAFHLRNLCSSHNRPAETKGAPSSSSSSPAVLPALIKNRRYAYMTRELARSDYFDEDSMRQRAPELYHYYVGQYGVSANPLQTRDAGTSQANAGIVDMDESESESSERGPTLNKKSTSSSSASSSSSSSSSSTSSLSASASSSMKMPMTVGRLPLTVQPNRPPPRGATFPGQVSSSSSSSSFSSSSSSSQSKGREYKLSDLVLSTYDTERFAKARDEALELSYQQSMHNALDDDEDEYLAPMRARSAPGRDSDSESEQEEEEEEEDDDEAGPKSNNGTQPVQAISHDEREQLLQEFRRVMEEKFLTGEDEGIDYKSIDADESYDDTTAEERDAQDDYFEESFKKDQRRTDFRRMKEEQQQRDSVPYDY